MTNNVVEEIKSKVDIVDIVSNYVRLKKSGSSYKGLCPFHQEKTPSFFVSPERQFFKCFGCGAGGDVITFLMKIEGWSFYQTLKYLAKLTGVKLQQVTLDEDSKIKEELYQLNHLAARFYHYLLTQHPRGEVGRQYLKQRKIKNTIIKDFYLGVAPSGWASLTNFLRQKKKNLTLAVKAGLIIEKNGRYYDRFRDRLIFPLFNILGEIVGFGGRRLHPDENIPKYINTPETIIYNKSRHLFGLYQAKEVIRQKKEVIITEGEFDVLSSYQAGVKNIVAVKGSALTEDHLKTLRRYSPQIIFCFDSDSAGIKATQRSFLMAENQGLKNKVVILPHGKDIDELVKQNPTEWPKLIEKAEYTFSYLLKIWQQKIKPDDPYSKNETVDSILELIGQINNPLLQKEYLQLTANTLGIEESLLYKLFDKKVNQKSYPHKHLTTTPKTTTSSSKSYLQELEAIVLSLLIRGVKKDYLEEVLSSEYFSHYGYRRLLELLKQNQFNTQKLLENLSPELTTLYNELSLLPTADKILGMSPTKQKKEIQKITHRLRDGHLKIKIEQLKTEIAKLEQQGKETTEQNKQLASYLKKLRII